MPLNKIEKIFLKKIFLFFLGLINSLPTEINVYERIIGIVELNILPTNTFYTAIAILIVFFRILIILLTIYEALDIVIYAIKHREK